MRTIDHQRPLTGADREDIHRAIVALVQQHGAEFVSRQPMLLTDERFDGVDFDSMEGPTQLFGALLDGVDVGVGRVEFVLDATALRFSELMLAPGVARVGVGSSALGEDIPGWVAEAALLVATLRASVELERPPTDAELLAYTLLSGHGALLLSGATRVRKSGDTFHTLTQQSISGPWEASTWAYGLALQLSVRANGHAWFVRIRDTTPSREARPLLEAAWAKPERMALFAYFTGVDPDWRPPIPSLELVGVDSAELDAALAVRNAGLSAIAHRSGGTVATGVSALAGAAVGLLITVFVPVVPLLLSVVVCAGAGAAIHRQRARLEWRCSECVSELAEGAEQCSECGARIHAFVRNNKEWQAARLEILDEPIVVTSIPRDPQQKEQVSDTPHAALTPPRTGV